MKKLTTFLKVFTLIILISGISLNIQAQNEEDSPEIKEMIEKIIKERIPEFRTLLKSKLDEYQTLKPFLVEENKLLESLKSLQAEIRNNQLLLRKFDLEDSYFQDEIFAQPVNIEVETNLRRLSAFFDKIATNPKLMFIYQMNIKQLEKQTANRTLNAQFSLAIYYKKADLIETKRLEFSTGLEEQKDLENRINKLDSAIYAIRTLRSSQAGASAVLEVLRERIAMTPGVFLESVKQEGNVLTIQGTATDEGAVTRFGSSLEFSGGLFSDLGLETQRKDMPGVTLITNDPNAQIPQIVAFTIRCAYTPSKSGGTI